MIHLSDFRWQLTSTILLDLNHTSKSARANSEGLKKTNKKIITNTVRRWQFHTLLMQVLGLIPSVDTCRICFSHKTRTLQLNLKSIPANIESYISNNKSHVAIPLQLRYKNRIRNITALSIKKTKFVLMQQKYNHVESVLQFWGIHKSDP